jgi:hypothetical protein
MKACTVDKTLKLLQLCAVGREVLTEVGMAVIEFFRIMALFSCVCACELIEETC